MRKWSELQLGTRMTSPDSHHRARQNRRPNQREITIAPHTPVVREEAKRVYGDVIPTIGNDRRLDRSSSRSASARHYAVEFSVVHDHLARSPALAAGCTVVTARRSAVLRAGSRRTCDPCWISARRPQCSDRRCALSATR